MTTRRQPHIKQEFYYESASNLSSLTPTDRDVVPVGTVASRIIELHNLAKPPTSSKSLSPVTHRRDDSRTGFGQRTSPRFGQPASRSSESDADIRIDSKHSFLGLNTHHGNHLEEHAMVDKRMKWGRSTGLHAQLQPSGLGARVQYEATSPWGVLPKGQSQKNLKGEYNNKDIGTPVQSRTKSQASNMTPTSQISSSSHHSVGGMSIKREISSDPAQQESRRNTAIYQRKAPTSYEWLLLETSSIIHRQSGQGLYYYYGIQRPAKLVSLQNITFYPEDMPQSLVKYRHCHVCSRANVPDTIKCRCGHSLCEACDSPWPETITTSDGSSECIGKVHKHESEQLRDDITRNLCSDSEVLCQTYRNPQLKQQSTQENPHQQETSKKHRSHSGEKLSSISGTFPILRSKKPTPRHGSLEIALGNVELPTCSRIYQQTTIASEAQTSIRGPPLLATDALSSTRHLSQLPIEKRVRQPQSQDIHRRYCRQGKFCYHRGSHSSASSISDGGSENGSCDSVGCHATHKGYRPYRHSITCMRKKRRYPEETDSGYIASVSHLEELEFLQRKANPDSIAGTHRHHSFSKEDISRRQSESDSPQGEDGLHKHDLSSHQESCGEHEASPRSRVDQPGSVGHRQEHFHPREHGEHSFIKTASSLPENFQRYDQPRIENGHQSSQNASVKFDGCQRGMKKYQSEISRTGHGQARSCVHDNRPKAPRQSTPADANASVATPPMSPQTGQKILSELIPSYSTKRSMTTVSTPKPHLGMKSPEWLIDDTAVSAPKMLKEEMLTMCSPSTGNAYQLQPERVNDIRPKTKSQVPGNVMIALPSTHVEDDCCKHPADSHVDLRVDTIASVSIQLSDDLSSRNCKPPSLRLSAFFKLHEQNTVSLLNKRLQDHQEALKRIERACDGLIGFAVPRVSLDHEEDGETEGKKNGGLDLTASKSTKACEHNLSYSPTRPREEDDMVSKDPGIVMKDTGEIVQKLNTSGSQSTTKVEEKEACDIGINGITIVLHLEGREDAVIKTELSHGI